MPPDTPGSATLEPVNTPHWKMRLDPKLRDAGKKAAGEAGEDLTSLLRLGIQAIVVDARAFIVACHNIIREEKK
jgi:hypothetical protein